MSSFNYKVPDKGTASVETQMKYLRKCLQIKEDQLADVKVRLSTEILEVQRLTLLFDKRLHAAINEKLAEVYKLQKPKRPWYRFWRNQ